MNKIYYKIMLLTTVAALLSACGASKQLTASKQQQQPQYTQQQQQQPQYTQQQQQQQQQQPLVTRVKEEIDECEKLSFEIKDGQLRAYGSAIDADKDFARQIAASNARGQLATDIKALVTNVMRSYRNSTRENTNTHSQSNIDQEITQIAEEIVANSFIICSNRYVLSNGNYESVVCISMKNNIEEIIKDNTLSDDAKMMVKFDQENYRKSYQEELDKYRQQKLNGGN